jgi:hypothetical protein
MSPYARIGIAAVVAILIASGWQLHQRQARMEEAGRLREENSRLRLEASQRGEARHATLQAGGTKIAPMVLVGATPADAESSKTAAHSSGAPAGNAASAGRGSPGSYRNEGQSTPHAALQTFAWACDQGDEELMRKLLVFDDIARKKTEAHFAGLPPGARPTGVSLEAMAAALYVSDGIQHPYPVAEVLAHARFEPVGPARMILRLPGANGDGYEFQQTAEGWKVAITEAVVDDYIRESANAPKP